MWRTKPCGAMEVSPPRYVLARHRSGEDPSASLGRTTVGAYPLSRSGEGWGEGCVV